MSHGQVFPKYSHLLLDKMATILQTIFADAFLCMKSFVLWLKFHWNLLLPAQLTITQHWLNNGLKLAPNRRQAIIWTNADPIHWRIYGALGGDELKTAHKRNCCHGQTMGYLYIYNQMQVLHCHCWASWNLSLLVCHHVMVSRLFHRR